MNGIEVIARERARQIEVEGWLPSSDDEHKQGELSDAAAAYCESAASTVRGSCLPMEIPGNFPWDSSWWKPSGDPVRDLAKAGALIAAQIDVILRQRATESADAPPWTVPAAPNATVLRDALELARHMLGPHLIRSCGTCEKCGGMTSNGTLKVCRKCGMEIINSALGL